MATAIKSKHAQYLTQQKSHQSNSSFNQSMTPEFKDQLYGYLQLLRGKIKSMEVQMAEMNQESN
jgi:hypothetical protein